MDHLSYFPALLARVTELAEAGRNNRQIADTLNAERFRPPKRTSRFTGEQVRAQVTQRGVRRQPKGWAAVLTSLPPGQWSVPGLADELGTHPNKKSATAEEHDHEETALDGYQRWAISIRRKSWQELITNSAATGVPSGQAARLVVYPFSPGQPRRSSPRPRPR